jgi:hypothetical protein
MHYQHRDAMARAIADALALTEGQRCRVRDALERYWQDRIALVWSVEDVLARCQTLGVVLSAHDADLALEVLWEDFETERGIIWDALDQAIRRVSG